MTTSVAAIDCGTNSIRLLIAEGQAGSSQIRDLAREMRIVRLGQGVDETRRFHPEALERTFAAAREYGELIRSHGVEHIRFAATSATRDAENRNVFLAGMEEILGVRPEVITGEEEARLSFAGAARVIGPGAGTVLVVDLGGGSTELVMGSPEKDSRLVAVSMDIGSVRITERHLHSDPPTPEEIESARRDIREQIAEAAAVVPLEQVDTLVGTAGTITTVTAHALGLETYLPERINGAQLSAEAIDAACSDLLHRSREQRGELGFLHPGRIDVIGAGALLWSELVHAIVGRRTAAGRNLGPVMTSEHDILDGLALSLLA